MVLDKLNTEVNNDLIFHPLRFKRKLKMTGISGNRGPFHRMLVGKCLIKAVWTAFPQVVHAGLEGNG